MQDAADNGSHSGCVDCSSTRCVCKSASSEDVRKASRAVLPVRRASYAQPPDAVARHLGPSGNNPFTLQIPAGDETPQASPHTPVCETHQHLGGFGIIPLSARCETPQGFTPMCETPKSPGFGIQLTPRQGHAAKHAKLCDEADWVLFDPDDSQHTPVYTRRPVRPDGSMAKLRPRSAMQRRIDMPASEKQRSFDDNLFREAIFSEKQGSLEEQLAESMMVGVQAKEGHLQLPRCRSVEVSIGIDVSPIARLQTVRQVNSPCAANPLSRFACSTTACSSVSTADEWRQRVHVE